MIKEEQDSMTKQTIPRKYFSGGVAWDEIDLAMISDNIPIVGEGSVVEVNLIQQDTIRRVDLKNGARILTPLSIRDFERIKQDPDNYDVSRPKEGVPASIVRGLQWGIYSNRLKILNDHLELQKNIKALILSNGSRQELVIMDWGCGNAQGVIELAYELRKRNIRFKIYGLSNKFYVNWENAPPEIIFILDDFSRIKDYLKDESVDLIFSLLGISHIIAQEVRHGWKANELRNHIADLMEVLRHQGVFIINGQVPGHLFQFTPEIFRVGPYRYSKVIKQAVNAAMPTVEMRKDDGALQTNVTDRMVILREMKQM